MKLSIYTCLLLFTFPFLYNWCFYQLTFFSISHSAYLLLKKVKVNKMWQFKIEQMLLEITSTFAGKVAIVTHVAGTCIQTWKIIHRETSLVMEWFSILKRILEVWMSRNTPPKGRGQRKKNVFFRALPELPKPPPHDPNSGNLVLFFRKSKFKIWKSV